ncbi:MAG TPA: TolC family protein [Longimicrobiaceae bacterium]|nr:TolC family protein [Longimicrobiaceae bacterium]
MPDAFAVPAPFRRICRVVLPLGWIAAASAASGQEPHPPGLTLDAVVRTTLEASAEVRSAEAGVRRQEGVLQEARGAFDPRLSTVLSARRVQDPSQAGAADAPVASSLGMEYGVAVDRRLRSGIVLAPQVSVSRTEAPGTDLLARNLATASLDVRVPLGRGRGGGVAAAQVTAARGAHAAAAADLRHRRDESALRSVEAYWGYLAAVQRLDVLRRAETRAARLVDETRRLVEADQLPAADLVRVAASLASRRAARIAGEQGLTTARQALGLAMGIPADSLATLPPPATPFPAPGGSAPDSVPSARAVVAEALRARDDLAAVRRRREAAQTLQRGARSEMRPQVDLELSLGYTGAEDGGALDRMLAPLSGRSGFHAGVQLSTGLALGNRSAEGMAMQSAADEQDAASAERELARRIALEAETATRTLGRSAEELAQTAESVRLNSTAVENERRKFQLGGSTLFDVLYAEDGLTSATLAHIDGELRHATALARLRFAAGSLAPDAGGPRRD